MSRICRSFLPAFKAEVALQALCGDKSQAALCREHNLNPEIVTRWKPSSLEHASGANHCYKCKTDRNSRPIPNL